MRDALRDVGHGGHLVRIAANVVLEVVVCCALASCASGSGAARPTTSPTGSATSAASSAPGALADGRYLYVLRDGAMDVYAMDRGFALVAQVSLPTGSGTRGVAADPQHHALFLTLRRG